MTKISLARLLALVGSVLVWSASVSSCGGGGNGSCGKVQPCGGSVVGNWKLVSSCGGNMTMPLNFADCPTATAKVNSTGVSGTLAFNADMTYTSNATLTGSATVTFPAECLTIGGITFTCAQFQQAFQAQLALMPGLIQSVRCGAAGTGCNCNLTLVPQTMTESGTYTTAGTTLTQTPTGSAPGTTDYCVQGNELHAITTMTGAMGATISTDVVAVKQ